MTDFLFGMPISGHIQHGGQSRCEQYPIESLRQILLDLINDPNVVEFGWTQYTPYFNDGDICEFGVHGTWIRTVEDDEDLGGYDLEITDSHPTLGTYDWVRHEKTQEEIWDERKRKATPHWPNPYVSTYEYREVPRDPKFPDTYARAKRLNVISSGNYDEALLKAFGDHCEVTVTKDGFQVDEYSHD